jgi:hypothetical protein
LEGELSTQFLYLRRLPPAKSRLVLKSLKRIVDDWTIRRSIDELPHARGHRSIAPDQIGEFLAGFRPLFVNGAIVPAQENAAMLFPPQNSAARFIESRVLIGELPRCEAHKSSEFLDIPLLEFDLGYFATVGALPAIGLIFDLLSDFLQAPLDIVMGLQMNPQPAVLNPLVLAQTANLDEIGNHNSIVGGRSAVEQASRPVCFGCG